MSIVWPISNTFVMRFSTNSLETIYKSRDAGLVHEDVHSNSVLEIPESKINCKICVATNKHQPKQLSEYNTKNFIMFMNLYFVL